MALPPLVHSKQWQQRQQDWAHGLLGRAYFVSKVELCFDGDLQVLVLGMKLLFPNSRDKRFSPGATSVGEEAPWLLQVLKQAAWHFGKYSQSFLLVPLWVWTLAKIEACPFSCQNLLPLDCLSWFQWRFCLSKWLGIWSHRWLMFKVHLHIFMRSSHGTQWWLHLILWMQNVMLHCCHWYSDGDNGYY